MEKIASRRADRQRSRSSYSQRSRSIAYPEGKLKDTRVDLSHVNAVIRPYEVGPDPRHQFPVHVDISRLFRRRELADLCKAALAASEAPMTTRGLALTSS